MKAREGLFLLSDALEIARRRLEAEREARLSVGGSEVIAVR